jgi:SAM-dependent methyltransferase
MAIDSEAFERFMGRALEEAGATVHAALVLVGDRLGLYRALAAGATTPAEVAGKTGTAERYVREWLAAQAAGGYVTYDAESGRYGLSPEQRLALVDPEGPDLPGLFLVASAVHHTAERMVEAFRSGEGVGWHEHHPHLFHGTERFFRPGYAANLLSAWLPSLEGVVERLQEGAQVADVGCGHGVTTLLMARAFPRSEFVGFDYHPPSIERAREMAAEAGRPENLRFEVAAAKAFPGGDYDLVTFFDCLHDMGDPVGAGAHVRDALRPDGTWMVVEPFAGDAVEENLNPIGRLFYSASTMICTPASLSQEVGLALGAQAGEARLREVLGEAGFSRVRRAAETPFNLVLEARP